MRIILAKNAGFCFGVRRAVEKAIDLGKTGAIYTLGELIHNTKVVEHLEARGVKAVSAVEEVPEGGTVVIRSHGVPPTVYEQIRERGLISKDLTCPFVKRIHERVFEARGKYDLVVIVGQAEHPEVIGIKGWAGEKSIVAATPEEKTFHQLSLSWGVFPVLAMYQDDTDKLFRHAIDCAKQIELVTPGDTVVITAGVPLNACWPSADPMKLPTVLCG